MTLRLFPLFVKSAPLALLALMAAAPPAPVMRPTRDVKIVYQMQPPHAAAAIPQVQYWNVAQQKLRIDLPTGGTSTLIDLQTNQVQIVRHDNHTILMLPGAPPAAPGTGTADMTKLTAQIIAGRPCTDWATKDGATICLTDDGVLLRATAHGALLTQAVSVDYAPQDAALFVSPAGYTVAK